MNVWHLYGLMVFLNATVSLSGMELTKYEQTLSPNARIIRRHLFSEKQLARYFDEGISAYTLTHNNVDSFLDSCSHVVYASPNIANPYELSHGISCIIRSGKDLITANTKLKCISIGKKRYGIGEQNMSPICSLAYTPECVAAGLLDGSFVVRNLHKDTGSVSPPCHGGPVTSIACIPSQHIYILGGGNTVSMHKKMSNAGKKCEDCGDRESIEFCGKTMSLGPDKKGRPCCADIIAVAGPFIAMQTKKNKGLIKSLYSLEAFNTIQGGTFAASQETLLVRMIEAQKNKWPMVLSDEDQEIYDSLCPTIRNVISHGWND